MAVCLHFDNLAGQVLAEPACPHHGCLLDSCLLMCCRFPADRNSEVEYRSASRLGDSDFDINRKRIKAIRLELQKKGWASTGFA